MDLIYLAIVLAFFASCYGLVCLCERLGGQRK